MMFYIQGFEIKLSVKLRIVQACIASHRGDGTRDEPGHPRICRLVAVCPRRFAVHVTRQLEV